MKNMIEMKRTISIAAAAVMLAACLTAGAQNTPRKAPGAPRDEVKGMRVMEQEPRTAEKKTVKEFLHLHEKDSVFCELTGVVSKVRNYQRGRLFIDDGTAEVLLYGMHDPAYRKFYDIDIRKGDTLTVRGYKYVYNGTTIEMQNAIYVCHSEGPDHDSVPKVDELDKNPTFKGKPAGEFPKWVSAHLKYPSEARDAHIEGSVKVKFMIGMNGQILEAEILEGLHPALDAEVRRVVLSSPKWKPGMVNGKAVRVTYTMPVFFSLER